MVFKPTDGYTGVPGGYRTIFGRAKIGASRRGVAWSLTLPEFYALVTQACHYCDRMSQKLYRNVYHNGIDRVDSSKGYSPDNCVPCCPECNQMKHVYLTPEETRVVAQALKSFRTKT